MKRWQPSFHSDRKTGHGYQLQFTNSSQLPAQAVNKSSTVPPQPTAASSAGMATGVDDDVWEEDFPQDALEEAILLESQACTVREVKAVGAAALSDACLWDDSDADLMDIVASMDVPKPVVSDCSVKKPSTVEKRPRVQELKPERPIVEEKQTKTVDVQYKLQGEVSVLRSELNKRRLETEAFRLESSQKAQTLNQQHQQQVAKLQRELDALQADLSFKNLELTEASKKSRTTRSSGASPPFKMPRLSTGSGSPGCSKSRRGFLSTEEFNGVGVVRTAVTSISTQTEQDAAADIEDVLYETAASGPGLVREVLLLMADGWQDERLLQALADLSKQPQLAGSWTEQLLQALVPASCAPLSRHTASLEALQRSHERSKRVLTPKSAHQLADMERAMMRSQSVCVTVLSTLSVVAEWPGMAPQLLLRTDLCHLVYHLMRPFILRNEVRNAVAMEFAFAYMAKVVQGKLPEDMSARLEALVCETLNTKPPRRLLIAVLELLISMAGTGDLSQLWCSHPSNSRSSGTCLMKKLNVLFNERDVARDHFRYSIPSNHSKFCSVASSKRSTVHARMLRDAASPPSEPVAAAVAVRFNYQYARLVSLVLSRPNSRPVRPCCLNFISVLLVRLLCRVVVDWEHNATEHAGDVVCHLISALHLLSSVSPGWSASVARFRVHYLSAMETIGRCWKRLGLTKQTTDLLQELYKFKPGTYE